MGNRPDLDILEGNRAVVALEAKVAVLQVILSAWHFEAGRKERKMLLVALIAGGVVSWISGFLFGFLFHKTLWWISLLINAFALAAFLTLR